MTLAYAAGAAVTVPRGASYRGICAGHEAAATDVRLPEGAGSLEPLGPGDEPAVTGPFTAGRERPPAGKWEDSSHDTGTGYGPPPAGPHRPRRLDADTGQMTFGKEQRGRRGELPRDHERLRRRWRQPRRRRRAAQRPSRRAKNPGRVDSSGCPSQRWARGTSRMTWSTCWPQPAQVVLPQVRQVTALHIGNVLPGGGGGRMLVRERAAAAQRQEPQARAGGAGRAGRTDDQAQPQVAAAGLVDEHEVVAHPPGQLLGVIRGRVEGWSAVIIASPRLRARSGRRPSAPRRCSCRRVRRRRGRRGAVRRRPPSCPPARGDG